jgi:hypothetical protein
MADRPLAGFEVEGRAPALLQLGDQLTLQVLKAAAADLTDETGDGGRADAGLGRQFLNAFQAGEGVIGENGIGDLALAGRQLPGGLADPRADRRRRFPIAHRRVFPLLERIFAS